MRTIVLSMLTFALALIPVQTRAQQDGGDKSYARALIAVQTLGELGGLFKDWCDERVPGGASAHEAALKAWRAAASLDEVDARAAVTQKGATRTPTSKRRADFYAKLDRAYNDPAAACRNLKKNLLSEFNVQKMYPDEHKLVLSRPLEGAAQQEQGAPAMAEAKAEAEAAQAQQQSQAPQPPPKKATNEVATEQVRAAAGKGIKTADVVGIIHHGEGKYTVSGYKFFETVGPILLKNGMAYARALPPERLDAEKSQRLEPQKWGQWRARDKGYEVRWRSGTDNAFGEWTALKGTLRKPFAPDTKLNATYEKRDFHGSVGFGGMAFRTTYVFKPDGRIEVIDFAQGSAGSVAADGGFSSSSTSTSSGEGTTTVTSTSGTDPANNPVTSAPSVVVTGSSSKDDGAERRGRYKLNGYTLEITFDSGRKTEMLLMPSGPSDTWVLLGGKTFMPPSRD